MTKVMFDANAFSRLIDSQFTSQEFFAKCTSKYEFYVSAVQVEELAKIPDCKMERRIQHFLCLCQMRAKLFDPIAVVGHVRLGYCLLGSAEDPTYNNLLTKTGSNVDDAMIGEVAKREGCVLVTNDTRFIKKLKAQSIQTMTFEEFIDTLEDEAT